MEKFTIKETSEKNDEFLSYEKILHMSPKTLKTYIDTLDHNKTLEAFFKQAIQDDRMIALISYWEKWYKGSQREMFEKLFKELRLPENEKSELPIGLEKKFSEDELKIICSNTCNIQLNFGCSHGCPFCANDSPTKVREHISFQQIENLVEKYREYLSKAKPFFYHQSDVSDYKYTDKDNKEISYSDIIKLVKDKLDYSPYLVSRNILDDTWLNFIKQNNGTVSAQGITDLRVEQLRKMGINTRNVRKDHIKGVGLSSIVNNSQLGKYSPVKSKNGVVLSPRGLYNMLNTYTSENFPQGRAMVPIQELKDITPRAGNSMIDVLGNSIIRKQDCDSKKFQDTFYEIYTKSKKYLCFLDNKLIITKVIEVPNNTINNCDTLAPQEGKDLNDILKTSIYVRSKEFFENLVVRPNIGSKERIKIGKGAKIEIQKRDNKYETKEYDLLIDNNGILRYYFETPYAGKIKLSKLSLGESEKLIFRIVRQKTNSHLLLLLTKKSIYFSQPSNKLTNFFNHEKKDKLFSKEDFKILEKYFQDKTWLFNGSWSYGNDYLQQSDTQNMSAFLERSEHDSDFHLKLILEEKFVGLPSSKINQHYQEGDLIQIKNKSDLKNILDKIGDDYFVLEPNTEAWERYKKFI